MNGRKKHSYLVRYLKYSRHYQNFKDRYSDAVSDSNRYEEFLHRKKSKDKVQKHLYDETAALLEAIKNPKSRLIAELTFLDGLKIEEIATLFGLSVQHCGLILGEGYKDIHISELEVTKNDPR
ncbi:hypothetical protein [Enterococcus xiangfangensis]|uniref:RNA polymerase sigma factor 70 region 4 type 2 domain-containing protein n=1 Tax=Enterococcus xiangfangensis TaxID=1296537 RepID=A0ABU3FDK3_9ENTE|nr:hypothetical protein [Enterococcus xiangfangensis]MDT2760754.1 hypothetical protein [Enterococcus xiangfangensis]